MSFASLYDLVQHQGDRISTKWLRARVIELSTITKVTEFWSGVMDHTAIRGFYIERPLQKPIQLAPHESLIGMSRAMCTGHLGDHWRRFVLTKELMHAFDEPDEKADTSEKFHLQIEKFSDPSAPTSPQFRAESKAFWRAIAVLCREEKRQKYKELIANNEMSFEVIGAAIEIPAVYVREMVRDEFDAIIANIK